MLVFVGERVFNHAVAHATVLACRRVGAIGIVNIVLHGLGKLALEPAGSGDRIDDVAALFVHDDAARPNSEFRITHDSPMHSLVHALGYKSLAPLPSAFVLFDFLGLPRADSRTARKSRRKTTKGGTRVPS